ncbi:Rne/Rng family ribonuclease [Rhodothermus profundi]|uniref:Ribonuclease G n=1 Tax=Rhodothermus profundi TaxID=633813 RepID=A0A1M6TTX3_9BACT|nr:Rne/Rng family ribonuclease [Rhodothermus profundi]SHK60340.1 ribonuclease G [Rhodothermus profundi]
MAKEIIINAEKDQTRIAIVENGTLGEFYIEDAEHERTIGNIYLARVCRVMPSIQAAFVDIGQQQDAFLHFSDIAPSLPLQLKFLADPQPSVRKLAAEIEQHHQSLARRRHPRPHRTDPSETSADKSSGGAESTHRRRLDARLRGRRRSAQRRLQRKLSPQTPSAEAETATASSARLDFSPEALLKRDQPLLVKIIKEPISSKGSRVSTDISLAGRFLVLVPFANYVAVSKKITSYKERRRLRALAQSLVPEGFGVIVRTVAEGQNAKALDTDLRLLLEKWERIEKKLAEHPAPPLLLHEDVNMVSSVIRDLFSEDCTRILVDNPRLHRNIRSYVQAVAPHKVDAVQLYQGKAHIFAATGIAQQVAQAFESRVDLPSGGYLYIEHTEAMHVIDVNSGRAGRGLSQEENSLRVNLEAARVIAQQVRVRDLGGIIVIDFIDLKDEKNKKKVYDELKKEFKKDRAVTKILPMSDFGLVQITRQRLRPSLTTTFDKMAERLVREKAVPPASAQPTPEALLKAMERWLQTYRRESGRRHVTLRVHPFTAAYLTRRVPAYPTRWLLKHLVRVRLESDPHLPPLSFRFEDPATGEDLTDRFMIPQNGQLSENVPS